MATMREKWTDERLDDLNHRVEKRFDQVDARFERVDARFDRVEQRIESLAGEMNARFDSLQRVMTQGVIALSGAMLAGFGGMIALVATQL